MPQSQFARIFSPNQDGRPNQRVTRCMIRPNYLLIRPNLWDPNSNSNRNRSRRRRFDWRQIQIGGDNSAELHTTSAELKSFQASSLDARSIGASEHRNEHRIRHRTEHRCLITAPMFRDRCPFSDIDTDIKHRCSDIDTPISRHRRAPMPRQNSAELGIGSAELHSGIESGDPSTDCPMPKSGIRPNCTGIRPNCSYSSPVGPELLLYIDPLVTDQGIRILGVKLGDSPSFGRKIFKRRGGINQEGIWRRFDRETKERVVFSPL